MRSHINRALASDHLGDDDDGIGSDMDVPDHLPGSPLCPLDSRQKHSGNSVCPLHGRKKDVMAAKVKADAKRMGSLGTARREPEIVFDSSPAIGP